MPFRLDCPRCRQSLWVPRKKAGSLVNCPKCQSPFLVPEDLPADSSLPEPPGDEVAPLSLPNVAVPPPPASAPPAVAPPPLRNTPAPSWTSPPGMPPPPPPSPSKTLSGVHAIPTVQPPMTPPAAPSVAVPPPAQPPWGSAPSVPVVPVPVRPQPAPVPRPRKVARLITPESVQSMIQPSPDGKLPELHLEEGQRAAAAKTTGRSMSPMLLVAILAMSVGLSIVMVLWEGGDAENSALAVRKAQVRQAMAEEYFSSLDNKQQAIYQTYLREAKLANSRGDYAAERGWYRKVLDLLRQERGPLQRGLTGSQARDKRLEEYIGVLLSEQ